MPEREKDRFAALSRLSDISGMHTADMQEGYGKTAQKWGCVGFLHMQCEKYKLKRRQFSDMFNE